MIFLVLALALFPYQRMNQPMGGQFQHTQFQPRFPQKQQHPLQPYNMQQMPSHMQQQQQQNQRKMFPDIPENQGHNIPGQVTNL